MRRGKWTAATRTNIVFHWHSGERLDFQPAVGSAVRNDQFLEVRSKSDPGPVTVTPNSRTTPFSNTTTAVHSTSTITWLISFEIICLNSLLLSAPRSLQCMRPLYPALERVICSSSPTPSSHQVTSQSFLEWQPFQSLTSMQKPLQSEAPLPLQPLQEAPLPLP